MPTIVFSVLEFPVPPFEFLPKSLAPVFVFCVLEFRIPVPPFEFLTEQLTPAFVFSVLQFPVPFFEFLSEHPAF